jgi:hypothetical protein
MKKIIAIFLLLILVGSVFALTEREDVKDEDFVKIDDGVGFTSKTTTLKTDDGQKVSEKEVVVDFVVEQEIVYPYYTNYLSGVSYYKAPITIVNKSLVDLNVDYSLFNFYGLNGWYFTHYICEDVWVEDEIIEDDSKEISREIIEKEPAPTGKWINICYDKYFSVYDYVTLKSGEKITFDLQFISNQKEGKYDAQFGSLLIDPFWSESVTDSNLVHDYDYLGWVKQRSSDGAWIATGELDWNNSNLYLSSGLLAYYKMNDYNSTNVYDSSGNNYHALRGGDTTISDIGLWDSTSLDLNGVSSYVLSPVPKI